MWEQGVILLAGSSPYERERITSARSASVRRGTGYYCKLFIRYDTPIILHQNPTFLPIIVYSVHCTYCMTKIIICFQAFQSPSVSTRAKKKADDIIALNEC